MDQSKEKLILRMMRAFSLNYSGFQMDDEGTKAKLWETLLAEFDGEVIKQATLEIVSTRKNEFGWAPDIATVREQCLNIRSGILNTPTGSEAWSRILRKVGGEELELTETEKQVRDETLGKYAIYDLKHGIIKDITWARRDFVKAFDQAVAKQRIEALTPSSVKSLVDKNAPQLPASTEEQLPPPEPDESNLMSMAEAREAFGDEAFEALDNMMRTEDERR